MEVPLYARVLQERTSATTSPVKIQSPRNDKLRRSAKSLSSNFQPPLFVKDDEEIKSLCEENARLHKHIDIQNENFSELQKSFINVQQQLNQERATASETVRLLADLKSNLEIEQEKNSALIAQIDQLDKLIKSRQQVATSREEMTQRLQQEYHTLVNDYNHVVETVSSQAKQIRDQRNKIRELESQLRNVMQSPIREPKYNSFSSENRDSFDFDEKPKYKSYNYDNDQLKISIPSNSDNFDYNPTKPSQSFDEYLAERSENRMASPEAQRYKSNNIIRNRDPGSTPTRLSHVFVGDYSPLKSPQKSKAPFAIGNEDNENDSFNNRRSPAKDHPAIHDSISFGEENEPAQIYNSYSNIDEMKKEMDSLIVQKEFIESMLKVPQSKTVSLAQHKREQQQWQQKLEVILKQLSTIRLQLRRMREL